MTRGIAGLWLLIGALAGCGEGGPGLDRDGGPGADAPPTPCGPNLKAYRGACLPILDDCPGQQVPVLGGGCKKVGVEECDGGWGIKGPPDWTCTPVGPPRECLPGWATVAGAWCEPVVPASPCPEGKMEVIGKSECQPVGECGTGSWGNTTLSGSTIFVDGQATAPGDGSQAKPFTAIADALKAATSGAQIVIAEGEYVEDVLVDRPLTLEGRCAELVRIKGAGPLPATIGITAKGVLLRGFTVLGQKAGVGVLDAKDVVVEKVIIQGSADAGLWIGGASEVTLRQALISKCVGDSVAVHGARLTVERSTVRHTQRAPDWGGDGVYAEATYGVPSTISLTDSVLLGNWRYGLLVQASTATVERTLVKGTHKDLVDDLWAAGIGASGEKGPTTLVVRDSVLAENRVHGLDLTALNLTVERTVVRDTLPKGAGDNAGNGLGIALQGAFGDIVIRDSLLTRNRATNLWLGGAGALVERSRISDALPNTVNDHGGVGVAADYFKGEPSRLRLRSSIVSGAEEVALRVKGAEAWLDGVLVKGTPVEGRPSRGGILAFAGGDQGQVVADLRVADSAVVGCGDFGIYEETGALTMERSVISDTRKMPPGLGGALTVFQSNASVVESLFDRNRYVAVGFLGSEARMERSRVRDTSPELDELGYWGGFAVYAGPPGGPVVPDIAPSSLVLRDSLLSGSQVGGLQLVSATVLVERSRISGTRDLAQTLGDGLVGRHDPTYGTFALAVRDTLVEGSARTGLLLVGGTGAVERSLFRGAPLCVALEEGASLDSKQLVCDENQENRISYGQGLKPAPPPPVPPVPKP